MKKFANTGRTIHQNVTFDTTPMEVYDTLMNARLQKKFTGSATTMQKRAGGSFTAYDGYITGKNIVLEPGKKIVQEWRAADWPAGHQSIVTYSFQDLPNSKTRLRFTHENVPQEFVQAIADGWKEYYWEPMKELFAQRK